MKTLFQIIKNAIFVSISILILSACVHKNELITFPYSQWTVGSFGETVSWQYDSIIECNNSFIARPQKGDWGDWYSNLLAYRKTVREEIGNKAPYLLIQFPANNSPQLHFVKIGYDLKLKPGETFTINGMFKDSSLPVKIYVDFILKKKGEEAGYIDRGFLRNVDSLEIKASQNWESFEKQIKIPWFNVDSFGVSPVLRFENLSGNEGEIYAKDIRISVLFSSERKNLLAKIEKLIQQQSEYNHLKIPEELSWTNRNYVMGFVFIWDQDFWNPKKGEFTVAKYCDKMQREFGGFQSVVLWHSYPNIGIDERNQFDFYRMMPGGIAGLKQVVDEFHKQNVKVFMTYNPWDISTRRPEKTDAREIAGLINECKFDGVYLDTWYSSAGIASIFSVENFIREEAAKTGTPVAFSTELTPEYKDLIGFNAITSSWGQDIHPYHYTDLSLLKWIMPGHKQHFITRAKTDRRQELSQAWINGQGIQVWENLFGDMNLWNANDRHTLRKMNPIWKSYGELYLTDNWKPFIPAGIPTIQVSMWETNAMKIWNAINESDGGSDTIKVQVDANHRYFDLWNGAELKPAVSDGETTIPLPVKRFGCLLQISESSEMLEKLLTLQKKEDSVVLPDSVNDPHTKELSLKYPANVPKIPYVSEEAKTPMLMIKGGKYSYEFSHLNREGRCYPNTNAKNNHDLVIVNEGRELKIIHKHDQQLASYAIMPSVITNGEFERFLHETNYSPRFRENFLKQWGGNVCPESIRDKAVVYVGLEDARAYAAWAGKRLPTEWEWQTAAEQYKEAFKINEVWEWNESERNDGFNRFVNLRGGCNRWMMTSSWWYLPGAPYGEAAGGPQPYNSHCKYFLMYPGMDRASTIGFRCVSLIK